MLLKKNRSLAMLSFITGVVWEIIRLYFFLIGVVAFSQRPLEWLAFTFDIAKFVEQSWLNTYHLLESYYYLP